MNADTPTGGNPVKQNDKVPFDKDRHKRAMRAFYESPNMPKECLLIFPYLLSRQGHREFAYPSHRKMAERFGVSYNTLVYWIDITAVLMAPVFTVQVGAAFRGSKGKGRSRYYCMPYHLWPPEYIDSIRNGSLPNVPPRRSKTYKPKPYQTIPEPKLPKRVASTIEAIKSPTVLQSLKNSVDTMERVVTTGIIEGSVENHICGVCGKFSPSGFEYNNDWVCERDGDCHQQSYEASQLF